MSILQERIYNKLNKIVDLSTLKQQQIIKLQCPGCMDLVFEYSYEEENGFQMVMAHFYIQNGDTLADPYMELKIIPEMKLAGAESYQKDGDPTIFNVDKKEINTFLDEWLSDIINQNYKPKIY